MVNFARNLPGPSVDAEIELEVGDHPPVNARVPFQTLIPLEEDVASSSSYPTVKGVVRLYIVGI